MRRVAVWIATSAGIGYAPVAPGTAGSLLALAIYYLTRHWTLPEQAALAAGVTVIGIWAAHQAIHHFGKSDPGPVVVDEVAGQLITLLGTQAGLKGVIAGFILFRAFDIFKPWPVNRLESLPGGTGIMADDIMAGAYACAILHGVLWLVPGIRWRIRFASQRSSRSAPSSSRRIVSTPIRSISQAS